MHYAAGLALLLLIGLMTGANLLVYSAYAMFAVFFSSQFLARKWATVTTAKRQVIQHEFEIEDEVSIGVQVTNESGWFVPWVIIEDVLPKRATKLPPVAIEKLNEPIRLCMLPGRKNRLLSYRLRFHRRGYFQIGPTVVETGDLFGLNRRYRTATPPDFILVLPKVIPLVGYDISSRRPIGEIRMSYRLEEDPTMISGIREYQMGDPMNRVHWAATARTGKLHSKVFQPTCVAGAMIVLDLHKSTNPDAHEPVRSDLAITAAASICHTLYQMGEQFGLLTNARDAVDRIQTEGWESDARTREEALQSIAMRDMDNRLRPVVVPVGRGADHFQEIHRTLARMELTDGLKLPQMLIESQSRLARDASVIVIVQEVDETAALALGLLRRQGYAVSAIINHHEQDVVNQAAGRLIAERIPVAHLHDEQSISRICSALLLKY